MKKINIVEMALRDGLQNEKKAVELAKRLALLDQLIRAGLSRIEIGAFVSPKWVPQMAVTKDFVEALVKTKSLSPHFSVLVPNSQGMGEAVKFPLKEVSVFTGATESFVRKNINCSIDESLARFEPVFAEARRRKIKVRGYISVALFCPYEGKVDPRKVLKIAKKLEAMGAYEISIGDTIGAAVPRDIEKLFQVLKKEIPIRKLAGHFHDTRGTAVANAWEAYQIGVRVFDSSAGGLGGCPYAPGSGGNVATEDLVYFFESMGVKTGVDLEHMLEMQKDIQAMVGHEMRARVKVPFSRN